MWGQHGREPTLGRRFYRGHWRLGRLGERECCDLGHATRKPIRSHGTPSRSSLSWHQCSWTSDSPLGPGGTECPKLRELPRDVGQEAAPLYRWPAHHYLAAPDEARGAINVDHCSPDVEELTEPQKGRPQKAFHSTFPIQHANVSPRSTTGLHLPHPTSPFCTIGLQRKRNRVVGAARENMMRGSTFKGGSRKGVFRNLVRATNRKEHPGGWPSL